MGPNTQALGVFGVATEVSWMPISDNDNDWVQLGGDEPCVRYPYDKAGPP